MRYPRPPTSGDEAEVAASAGEAEVEDLAVPTMEAT